MTLGSSILLLANNMMTKESIEKLKKKDNSFELEATIKLKYKTIEALKELCYHESNAQTYDQLIQMLLRSYKKHKEA